MTTVTAPLRDLRRAAEEAEKDAQTVAMLQRDLIEAQKVRIAELEMENETLKWLLADAKNNLQPFYDADDKITIAALAGVAEGLKSELGVMTKSLGYTAGLYAEATADNAVLQEEVEALRAVCDSQKGRIAFLEFMEGAPNEEVEALRAVALTLAEYHRFAQECDSRDCDDPEEEYATFYRKWQAVLNRLEAARDAGYLREGEEVGK